jgi:hypothetical protein
MAPASTRVCSYSLSKALKARAPVSSWRRPNAVLAAEQTVRHPLERVQVLPANKNTASGLTLERQDSLADLPMRCQHHELSRRRNLRGGRTVAVEEMFRNLQQVRRLAVDRAFFTWVRMPSWASTAAVILAASMRGKS